MHRLEHGAKIAQMTGPHINATRKLVATSEAYSVHLALRLLDPMLRWDCCCFTRRQAYELLVECVPGQVQVKRLAAEGDAQSWTVIWNPFRKKLSKPIEPEGMLRWKFDLADVQSVVEVPDEGLPEDDGDGGGVGAVVLTQTTMCERRWLTPTTALRFPCSSQMEVIAWTQMEMLRALSVFSERWPMRVTSYTLLAPPPRPKPRSVGARGPGFSNEVNIPGGRLLYSP